MSIVSKRLKQARLRFKISQKELGIASGIDASTASARMNQYEVGKRTPDFLTLKNIGKILNCPTAYFYAEDDMLAEMILFFSKQTKDKRKKLLETFTNL